MVAERIKQLRENLGITQIELAKRLGLTRSSVNAWEQGISVPGTKFIVELSRIFKISTDYILCVDSTSTLDLSGLTEQDILIIHGLAVHLRRLNQKS